MSIFKIVYYGFIKGIKEIRPYYFLDYQKSKAKAFLEKEYGWEYYGSHHFENIFTKFVLSYWLPRKFNIDKRLITFSAQILSGEMDKDDALKKVSSPFYDEAQQELDKQHVLKKLYIRDKEFNDIWKSPNKSFLDYPSHFKLITRLTNIMAPFIRLVYLQKPMTLVEIEARKEDKK